MSDRLDWARGVLTACVSAIRRAPEGEYPSELSVNNKTTPLYSALHVIASCYLARHFPALLLEISIFDSTHEVGGVNGVNGALVANPDGWPIIKQNPYLDALTKARCLINQKTEAGLEEFEAFLQTISIPIRRVMHAIERPCSARQWQAGASSRPYVCLEDQPECPARTRLVALYNNSV